LDKAWLDSDEQLPGVPPPSLFFGPAREPIIIPKSKGGFTSLGGRVPDSKLGFQDVANLVGRDQKLDVIDVATQNSSKWSLGDWADYITEHSTQQAESSSSTTGQRPRNKVYNVISLEISGTALAKKVRPPKLVSEIDWVDRYWPDVLGKRRARKNYQREDGTADVAEHDKEDSQIEAEPIIEQGRSDWPKVQLYCLMGMQGSFTEWHLDMGSTSVYYTVHTGSKVSATIRLAGMISSF
jgi:F-box/leucine-rich repeat protein 10/11